MRNRIVCVFMLVGFFFMSSCDKLLTFEVSDSTITTIDANPFPIEIPFDIPTPDVTTNSESEFAQNDTKVELVKEILLKELIISITSPSDKTFSFLKSIEIFISADGEDEIKLAWEDNVNSSVKMINLTTTSLALDKYVKKNTYKLRTKVTTQETLLQEVDLKIDFTFQVTADPL